MRSGFALRPRRASGDRVVVGSERADGSAASKRLAANQQPRATPLAGREIRRWITAGPGAGCSLHDRNPQSDRWDTLRTGHPSGDTPGVSQLQAPDDGSGTQTIVSRVAADDHSSGLATLPEWRVASIGGAGNWMS
jgi:hypothetical protein